LLDGDQRKRRGGGHANELELTVNRHLRRIIELPLRQASKELLGDSSVSTAMLMLHRLREYGSGRTAPMNTNMCVLGDANKKQPNKSTSDNNPSRSIVG